MTLLTTVFRVAARRRRARAFHPRGVVLQAVWRPATDDDVLPGSPLLAGEREARVRFSHGLGLPAKVPDLLGIAVKLPDVHGPGLDQDLLFASSGRGFVGRHLLKPARGLTDVLFSTLLPYEVAGRGRHALITAAQPDARPVSYLEVTEGASPPPFEVRVGGTAGPLLGTVHAFGQARPHDDPRPAFDPFHTGPELRPVGWLNRLRQPTYGASRAGRAPVERA